MNRINVIDLDKTLVSFDTFRFLIISEIKRKNFKILYFAVIRKFRLLNQSDFKALILKELLKKKNNDFFSFYGEKVFSEINDEVLKIIQKETDENTLNILISASPNNYIQPLIKKLGWSGSGSYFDESGRFIHLYGINKIIWLKERFNSQRYIYNFAISDSKTDEELLKLFRKKMIWNRK